MLRRVARRCEKGIFLASLVNNDPLNNRYAVGIIVQRRLSEDSPSLRSLRAEAYSNNFLAALPLWEWQGRSRNEWGKRYKKRDINLSRYKIYLRYSLCNNKSYNLCTDRMMEWFTLYRNKINVYLICKYYIIKRADDKE